MNNLRFSKLFLPKVSLYLFFIFCLIAVIIILEPIMLGPGIVVFLIIFYYSASDNNMRKKEIIRYIETLKFDIDSVTKDTLLRFPLPLLVAELTGEIIWYNSLFANMIEDNKNTESVKETLQNLLLTSQIEPDKNISMKISINGRHYWVIGNYVNLGKDGGKPLYIAMLYFLDQTEYINIEERFNETRPVVSIITIDNYEELMQNAEDALKPQILAEIDRRISTWCSPTGGILKKFERDKYLFIFEVKYLAKLEEKKFEIIDVIKEINIGNKIPVTLSIGIGLNAENFSENLSFAIAAFDIALGRGGDQVVIKSGDKFSFFGGRTQEVEKRTRVKARVIAHALKELIKQSEQVMIMGHANADIDSVGAALGLVRLAKTKGKNAYIVLNNSNVMIDNLLEKVYKDKEYEGIFLNRNEAIDRVGKKTLLIVVDTHRPSLTECPELLKFTDKIVVIDHHRRGTDFISDPVLAFHETYASSACELVTEIIHYLDEKVEINLTEAEALYAGIAMDTKNFTFKTGVRTFEAATFLKKFGVDTIAIKQLFQNDLNTYIARAEAVKNAEIISDIAISVCPDYTKNAPLITAQAADELLGISGIAASFVLCKVNEGVSISGRSLGDINVQVILEKLGGGGHITVAGAQIPNSDIEQSKEMLKEKIAEYLEENKEQ